jgi:hypothetical protein
MIRLNPDEYSKYEIEVVEDYQPTNNNMETFSWKKELKSFLITFAVGFALVIYDQLDHFTLEAFKNGAYLGVVMGAIRAGFKGVIEMFLRVYNK